MTEPIHAKTRWRHSHSFGVERHGTDRFVRHSFNHVHECELQDGHTHVLTGLGLEAVFPSEYFGVPAAAVNEVYEK